MTNRKIMVTESSLPDFDKYTTMLKKVWESKWLTNNGEFHEKLETEIEKYLDVDNVTLFTNGHLALETAIQSLGKTGEIITTPFTFVSTTHAISRSGCTPIFCDINDDDYTIDVTKIESFITEQTVAILSVHVYGNICDVDEIERIAKKYNLKVIYDAAHAFGVKKNGKSIANFGDISMFSFHATKVFNTIEGGALVSKDKLEKKKYELMKNFGIVNEDEVEYIGGNAKMNEFQAIMGLCNLENLDQDILKRKKIVERYRELLSGVKGLTLNCEQNGIESNYAYFPIFVDQKLFGISRDILKELLKKDGIYTRKYFYPLTNSFACYKNQFYNNETPVAQRIADSVLTLPLYAELSLESVNYICACIKKYMLVS